MPLVRQVTLPGRYPAHCPLEFGLSSPGGTTHARMTARVVPADSDRLAWLRPTRFARNAKCEVPNANYEVPNAKYFLSPRRA